MRAATTPLHKLSRLERAQHIARGLLSDLEQSAPALAAQRRAQLVAVGETWIAPTRDVTAPGAPVRVADAATALGVKPSTVYAWCSKPHVPVNRYPGGVLLEECRAYLADHARDHAA